MVCKALDLVRIVRIFLSTARIYIFFQILIETFPSILQRHNTLDAVQDGIHRGSCQKHDKNKKN
jgi:hypothetical protein